MFDTITNSKYNSHTEPPYKLLNMMKLPDLYKVELYKLYFKIEKESVPYNLTTVLNPLTHHYNTRREAVQEFKITHAFAHYNCSFFMIKLINKSPIIEGHPVVTSFVNYDILDSYELFCSVRNCYVCAST